MGEIVYNSMTGYFDALEKLGYLSDSQVRKLLVLSFYKDFMFSDYRGLISREDYMLIGKALDCIYGSSCLIPYPDYLKMGKLHLGEMSEMAQRIKAVEETEVLKAFDSSGDTDSDIIIIDEE